MMQMVPIGKLWKMWNRFGYKPEIAGPLSMKTCLLLRMENLRYPICIVS